MYPGDTRAVMALQLETEYGVIMPYQSRDLHGVMMLVSFLKIGGLRVNMEGKWKWVSTLGFQLFDFFTTFSCFFLAFEFPSKWVW
jgi:hypothetical protein